MRTGDGVRLTNKEKARKPQGLHQAVTATVGLDKTHSPMEASHDRTPTHDHSSQAGWIPRHSILCPEGERGTPCRDTCHADGGTSIPEKSRSAHGPAPRPAPLRAIPSKPYLAYTGASQDRAIRLAQPPPTKPGRHDHDGNASSTNH